MVMLVTRRAQSRLLQHFAIQMAAWGAAIGVFAGVSWAGLHIRDLSGATRLERFVWMCTGVDIGVIAVGVTLAIAGYAMARSAATLGAGTAIVIQGLSLFLLDLHFAALISR